MFQKQLLFQKPIFAAMKTIFDFVFLSLLYLGEVLTLNADTRYIAINAGASVAGAVVLLYFRRDLNYKERFFKGACASICGYIIAAVIVRYRNFDEIIEYRAGTYFLASLLSIFLIKGLLSFAEQNASSFVVTIFQRLTGTGGVGRNGDNGISIDPRLHATEQPNAEIGVGGSQVLKTEIVVKKDGKTTTPTNEGD